MNPDDSNDQRGALPPLGSQDKNLTHRPSRARYDKVKAVLDMKWRRREPQAERMMRDLVDALWDSFGDNPWTFCGLWTPRPDKKEFNPGAGRPEQAAGPAAAESPVGKAFSTGEPQRESARLWVPVFDSTARPWAVFEARSAAPFDDMDLRWIEQLLRPFHAIERPTPPPLP